MAQKAEEYGSHDKTFILEESGKVQVLSAEGTVVFEHDCEKGDPLTSNLKPPNILSYC